MPFVSPTLPNDGESADAGDISGPFLALLAVFNGHIGSDNLEPGTIPASIGDGDIDTAKLAGAAVTKEKLAAGAVSPDKIAAAAVIATSTAGVITPVVSTRMLIVTGLTETATIAVPTGTPAEGQAMTLRIKDNGVARTISWNAIYRAIGLTLPTATVAGKELYVSLAYNSVATKWDVLSVARQA